MSAPLPATPNSGVGLVLGIALRCGQAFHVVLLSIALAGCQFIDLGDELEEMQTFSAISGNIEQDQPSDNPVAVALFSEVLERDHLFDAQLLESRDFRFGAPPGKYFIFAFEDTNRDFRLQPDEPAGYYGNPTAIALEAGSDRTGIRIILRRGISLPDAGRPDAATRTNHQAQFPKLWAGRKNIGALASLDDHRFDDDYAKMGVWEPLRFTLDIGPGLFLLEPYDPNKTPVLFVHGIEGTPQVWRSMIEGLDRRRFQPWVFSYASGLPLDATARYMYSAVTQLRLLHGFENLYLVAHSMGGLVCQAFIDRYRDDEDRYLKLFVTLSTPWAGHSAAQLGVDYAPAVVPVWRDMAPQSAFLAAQRRSRLPEDLPYHLLFSYRGGLSSVANDGSVTLASQLDSAAQARAERLYGFDTGHVEILSDEDAMGLLYELLDRADDSTLQHQSTAGQ